MTATTLTDQALVVREGAARLQWSCTAGGRWALDGCWPDPRDRRQLDRHLTANRPLLVVVDARPEPVYILDDELTDGSADRLGLQEVPVPFLDWLPAAERARGTAFVAAVRDLVATTPASLIAELVLDDEAGAAIRFACRTRAGHDCSDHALRVLADYLFGTGDV